MTLQQAQTKIAEIQARTDVSVGMKSTLKMRVGLQYLRANPDADMADLG
jgi:hypothetical protein